MNRNYQKSVQMKIRRSRLALFLQNRNLQPSPKPSLKWQRGSLVACLLALTSCSMMPQGKQLAVCSNLATLEPTAVPQVRYQTNADLLQENSLLRSALEQCNLDKKQAQETNKYQNQLRNPSSNASTK